MTDTSSPIANRELASSFPSTVEKREVIFPSPRTVEKADKRPWTATRPTAEGLLPPPPPEATASLAQVQFINLAWCEVYGQSLPRINGVPIVQALSYELIQAMNRLGLQDLGLLPVVKEEAAHE